MLKRIYLLLQREESCPVPWNGQQVVMRVWVMPQVACLVGLTNLCQGPSRVDTQRRV